MNGTFQNQTGFADPNETDDQGCCALLRAAGSGHYHIVDYLLRHKVELDLPAAGRGEVGPPVSRRTRLHHFRASVSEESKYCS